MIRPKSSVQSIEKFAPDRFFVKLKSISLDNESNYELINLLSKYFGVPLSHIKIKQGLADKTKLIEIL